MSYTLDALAQITDWDFHVARYDYDVNGHLIYMARASIGSLPGAAKWQITRFTYTGDNLILKEWADAGSFDNVWDNRASLSYS
jgi:hypothetical protein